MKKKKKAKKKGKRLNKKQEVSLIQNYKSDEETADYKFLEDTIRRFCERKIKDIFGVNSEALRALDLVCDLMNKENGFIRDDGQSYYNHCIVVALTLINHEIYDEDIISAALLHDLVEDIPDYTLTTVETMFNENVANIVGLVTKKANVDYHISKNLSEYLDGIETNVAAVLIKTADRMHNMMTLKEKSLESKYKKALETERFYMPRFKKWRKIFPRYEDLFIDARNSIEPVINEIKDVTKQLNELVEILDLNKKDIKKLEKRGIKFLLSDENKERLEMK